MSITTYNLWHTAFGQISWDINKINIQHKLRILCFYSMYKLVAKPPSTACAILFITQCSSCASPARLRSEARACHSPPELVARRGRAATCHRARVFVRACDSEVVLGGRGTRHGEFQSRIRVRVTARASEVRVRRV